MILKLSYTERSFLLFQNQADQSKHCLLALRTSERGRGSGTRLSARRWTSKRLEQTLRGHVSDQNKGNLMRDNGIFFCVDLKSWIFGTIKKVEQGVEWNTAWQETYREIGGKSYESGKKECPMNGTKTLYLLGRINGGNVPYKALPIHTISETYSKNGAYAILAIELLSLDSMVSGNDLWTKVRTRFREETGEEAALSNQGGTTIAYKLWHLGLIAGV